MLNNENKPEVYFVPNPDRIGEMLFTFDGQKLFNLFQDYPKALTAEQKRIFDYNFPFWASFFSDRS